MEFIEPPFKTQKALDRWKMVCDCAAADYSYLLKIGEPPEIARSVLPNSLATTLALTANLREWRLILKLRTAKAAHPQMRQIMVPLLRYLQIKIPAVFDDVIPAEYPEPGALVTEGDV
jgi:thymidylate synthase (FAD)